MYNNLISMTTKY